MTPSIKYRRLIALATVAIAACLAPVAPAHDRDRDGRPVVAPARGGGLTGGELLRESWATGTYAGVDPFAGACKTLAPNVLLPKPDATGIATCDATTHTRLFVRIGSACSKYDLDPPATIPKHNSRAPWPLTKPCRRSTSGSTAATRSTSSSHATNSSRHRESCSCRPTTSSASKPGPVTFTAHAWGAVIRDLRSGRHSVTLDVRFTDGGTFQFTAIVTVARERHTGDHDDD